VREREKWESCREEERARVFAYMLVLNWRVVDVKGTLSGRERGGGSVCVKRGRIKRRERESVCV
jgi:hypothetical protein